MLVAHITSKYFQRLFFAMGRWLSVLGSSLVSLVSPELGSLGLSLEKEHRSESFWRGWCRRGRSEIPFFGGGGGGVLQFPRSRRLRDNRQQLPRNVHKTLKPLETNKKKWRCENKNKTKKNKQRKNNKNTKHKQNPNTTEKRKRKRKFTPTPSTPIPWKNAQIAATTWSESR